MFGEFVTQNIIWVGAFVIVANLLILSLLSGKVKGVSSISALSLPQLQRGGKSIILDVCEKTEFARSHIPDSINHPLSSINAENKSLMKFKDKTTIIICQSGTRSNKAAKKLVGLGFTDLHVLSGGLTAWTKENLPVITSK